MIINRTLLLLSLFAIQGCGTQLLIDSQENQLKNVGGVDFFTEDGEKGIFFVRHDNGNVQVCMAPQPDAVVTGNAGISASAPSINGDIGVKDLSQIGTFAEGGRNASVLIVRELFYRTCEFSLNYGLSKDEAKALYLENLQSLRGIISSQSLSSGTAAQLSKDN
jgi:hypothetical protein